MESAYLPLVELWTEDDHRVALLAGDHTLGSPGPYHRSGRQRDLSQMIGRFSQQGLLVGGADGGYIVVGARFQVLQVGFRGCPRIKHERQLLGLRGQRSEEHTSELQSR